MSQRFSAMARDPVRSPCSAFLSPGAAIMVATLALAGSPCARAEDVPFSGGVPANPELGNPDGLVETTWSDPTWVVAASDIILRQTDCLDECASEPSRWYARGAVSRC